MQETLQQENRQMPQTLLGTGVGWQQEAFGLASDDMLNSKADLNRDPHH
jgi:hypothetical protein